MLSSNLSGRIQEYNHTLGKNRGRYQDLYGDIDENI